MEEENEKRSAAQRESSRFARQLVELQRIAAAAKEDAAAAKLLSEVAQKKAGKADIKGRIAVLISVLGFLVELAVNWDKLLEFSAISPVPSGNSWWDELTKNNYQQACNCEKQSIARNGWILNFVG